MNTKAIGDATVAMVLARLALKGKSVLVPHEERDDEKYKVLAAG